MVQYECNTCMKVFHKKQQYDAHKNCKPDCREEEDNIKSLPDPVEMMEEIIQLYAKLSEKNIEINRLSRIIEAKNQNIQALLSMNTNTNITINTKNVVINTCKT